jgi:hypothetical protein
MGTNISQERHPVVSNLPVFGEIQFGSRKPEKVSVMPVDNFLRSKEYQNAPVIHFGEMHKELSIASFFYYNLLNTPQTFLRQGSKKIDIAILEYLPPDKKYISDLANFLKANLSVQQIQQAERTGQQQNLYQSVLAKAPSDIKNYFKMIEQSGDSAKSKPVSGMIMFTYALLIANGVEIRGCNPGSVDSPAFQKYDKKMASYKIDSAAMNAYLDKAVAIRAGMNYKQRLNDPSVLKIMMEESTKYKARELNYYQDNAAKEMKAIIDQGIRTTVETRGSRNVMVISGARHNNIGDAQKIGVGALIKQSKGLRIDLTPMQSALDKAREDLSLYGINHFKISEETKTFTWIVNSLPISGAGHLDMNRISTVVPSKDKSADYVILLP